MKNDDLQKVINVLERARKRPAMFFPLDKSGLIGFISGIHIMETEIFGMSFDSNITKNILRERGWDAESSLAPWFEMEERGFDVQSMIREVLTIEIETLLRIINK